MACRLFGAKPLSDPMLPYCQFLPEEHISVKFYIKLKRFQSRKCAWICHLRNGGHFVSASMCQRRNPCAKFYPYRRSNFDWTCLDVILEVVKCLWNIWRKIQLEFYNHCQYIIKIELAFMVLEPCIMKMHRRMNNTRLTFSQQISKYSWFYRHLFKRLCCELENTRQPSTKNTRNNLNHWGRVTHICVGKLTIIGSDNGLSPGRRQAIIWTNAGILLISPQGRNFNEILIEIWKCRLRNGIHLYRPQCVNNKHIGWGAINVVQYSPFNTLRPRQDGRHFPDEIFKSIFLNENVWISIKISLKFVPRCLINNIPALVQIMAWHRQGDKPLSEPMMVSLPTHICVTRPRWVKNDLFSFSYLQ